MKAKKSTKKSSEVKANETLSPLAERMYRILERESFSPTEIMNSICSCPTQLQMQDALSELLERKVIELSPDRKLRLTKRVKKLGTIVVRPSAPPNSTWYSICSCHPDYQEECPRCNVGCWENNTKHKVERIFYRLFPTLWRWWVNRKDSPEQRRLESVFPNLRSNK